MPNPHICSPPIYRSSTPARITAPYAVMRADPSEDSPVVSQAIFSEDVRVIDKTYGWVKIETIVDGYVGWIRKGEYALRKKNSPKSDAPTVMVSRPVAHVYHVKDTIYGPIMALPYESRLEVSPNPEDHNDRWIGVILPSKKLAYIQRGEVSETNELLSVDEVCKFSRNFLGIPYVWGGRSSFGYDCSGFVQMLYRRMGLFLPRDAQDQYHWKDFVDTPLEKVQPGNLVFFGPDSDHIRHVGFCLGNGEFIHATVRENQPYVRISKLSDPIWIGTDEWPFRRFTAIHMHM